MLNLMLDATPIDPDSKLIVSWLVGARDTKYALAFIDDLRHRRQERAGHPRSRPEGHMSTSDVERHNLTMRMAMRRFTRLTNAFSKKLESHCHALAVYFVWYNSCRVHKTLRVSPAMTAGVTDRLWSMEEIADLVEAAAPKPGPRGPYRKRSRKEAS